jgi:putative membrane protein insertion efficiency factor
MRSRFANAALWPRRALMALVRGYRLVLSPWLGNQCRFEPTCSVYALGALQAHGAMAGTYLAAGRILRCSPWCDGGHDPVPAQAPRLFAWSMSHKTCAASATPSSSSSKTSP